MVNGRQHADRQPGPQERLAPERSRRAQRPERLAEEEMRELEHAAEHGNMRHHVR